MGIRLTPAGRLRWESSEDEGVPAGSPSLQSAFETDWREALFNLAADKIPAQDRPSVRYWQQLAERHLTGLCHVPEDAESFEVEPLSSADCARWILTAPPMHGGEYLCEEILQRIWERLDGWVRETVTSTGGLAAFLQGRAPKWHQVGRVCFHLAENRNDEARPFAFMATYASGFGAAGRVKHLPLRQALEHWNTLQRQAEGGESARSCPVHLRVNGPALTAPHSSRRTFDCGRHRVMSNPIRRSCDADVPSSFGLARMQLGPSP